LIPLGSYLKALANDYDFVTNNKVLYGNLQSNVDFAQPNYAPKPP